MFVSLFYKYLPIKANAFQKHLAPIYKTYLKELIFYKFTNICSYTEWLKEQILSPLGDFTCVVYTTNKNTPKRIKISKIPFFNRFFSWRNNAPYKKGTIAPDLLMVEIIEISAPSCESAQK